MPPHGHGGDEEEEEIIEVRLDGPPFCDIKAKQGKGFDIEFERVEKFLGPGKMTKAEFQRDLDAINKIYIPSAHQSFIYMQAGSVGMMGAFVILIIMGIIGGTPQLRSMVIPIAFLMFLAGAISFVYSKWVEQAGIREGAANVKKLLDDTVNGRYANSPHRIKWTIAVHVKPKKRYQLGRTFMERPVISIYCLRSVNKEGQLTDWSLPASLLHSIIIQDNSLIEVS